ncbi:MAG: transcriptional repressor [Desulfobacterales bacterium]|nr:transcriptional repressor [Desulfobacteraceae bacterium]MDD3990743.1 transcriptional repressor [Desulfobacteraceae bacterium]MDY0310980.1 transcriptional repressor [Desulfobacterales bacterium]
METETNLRMTRQRQVILEELRRTPSHPGADELYARVRKRLPRISLGTIYRNLEVLSASGEIQKIETGGSLKRFDGNPEPHYHIRCLRCQKVVDAPVAVLPDIERLLEGKTDFIITGHRIEFLGICPKCQAEAESEN